MKKKLLSILLSLTLVVTMMPAMTMTAFATEPHTHGFAEAWTISGNTHYHACTAEGCDIIDYATCNIPEAAFGYHMFTIDSGYTTDEINHPGQHANACICGIDGGNWVDHDFSKGNCICGAEKPAPHTHGEVDCTVCNGRGYIINPNCDNCKGSGTCGSCGGDGACHKCGGSGMCSECGGDCICKACYGGGCDYCWGIGTCPYCAGSGSCEFCSGSNTCSYCAGSGVCHECTLCTNCGGTGKVEASAPAHTHGTGDDAVTFEKPISTEADLIALLTNGGSGYLTKDIKCDDDLTVEADCNLCLNGHVINLNENNITVEGTFNLYDCDATTEHKFGDDNGLWTWDDTLAGEAVKHTVTGGVITGGSSYGGVCVDSGGTFTMNNGKITGNTAQYCGGGVYVSDGTFTMNNGKITGNTAQYGGGVCVDSGCTFTMNNGKITGNTAQYGCGIQNSGSLYLTADSGNCIIITGNTATDAEGGIANWGTMHLSGKVIIKDNICTNKYSTTINYPINLATSTPIHIDGVLTGSEIYITHAKSYDDSHDTGVLTSGYTDKNLGAGLNDFFHYDGPSTYYMDLNTEGENAGELEVKAVPEDNYLIDIKKSEHGSVSAVRYAKTNDNVTLTVTPDEGYQLKSLKYNDGADYDITDDGSGYKFTMPKANVTVTAEFEEAVKYDLKINGTQVTSAMMDNNGVIDSSKVGNVITSGTVTYTPAIAAATAKVTLNNAKINIPIGSNPLYTDDSDLVIELVGDNTITSGEISILIGGDVTFIGDGDLTIEGMGDSIYSSGDCTFSMSGTVTTTSQGFGVYADSNIYITACGGKVISHGNDSSYGAITWDGSEISGYKTAKGSVDFDETDESQMSDATPDNGCFKIGDDVAKTVVLTANDPMSYDLWINDVQVTSAMMDNNGVIDSSKVGDVITSGTVTYTPASGDAPAKLTLDNATIEISEAHKTGVYVGEDGIVVELIGSNTVTTNDAGFALYGDSANFFIGSGSLAVTSSQSDAIYSSDDCTFSMSGTVTATSNINLAIGSRNKIYITKGAGKITAHGTNQLSGAVYWGTGISGYKEAIGSADFGESDENTMTTATKADGCFKIDNAFAKTVVLTAYPPDYLWFSATGGDVELSMKKTGDNAPDIYLEYSTDGTNWRDFVKGKVVTPITLSAKGTKVYIRNKDSADKISNYTPEQQWIFTMNSENESSSVAAGGNIMSLLDNTASTTEFTDLQKSDSAFYELFSGCQLLTDVSTLKLPAGQNKELPESCYEAMFCDCTSLKVAPALPATKLGGYCYRDMFQNCIALETAPALPATELKEYCYTNMFLWCEALKTAPELPATKLAAYCYADMFDGCTKLNHIEVGFTKWDDENDATSCWVDGVAPTGNFVCPETLDNSGHIDSDSGVPDGWSINGKYIVNGYTGEHGSVTPNSNSYAKDATVTLTVTPETGYKLKADTIKAYKTGDSNTTVSLTTGENSTYTFNMPAHAVTITAEFETLENSTYKFEVTAPETMKVNEEYTDASVKLCADSAKDLGYEHALIKVEMTAQPEGSNPEILATDTQGKEWNIAKVGQWGPSEGFAVSKNYSATTPLTLKFDKAGTYTAKFTLVDLDNDNTIICESTATVGVKKNPVTINAAADGFTYGDSGKTGYKDVSVTDNLVEVNDLVATYYKETATAGTYDTTGSTDVPKNAGNYKVVLSVPESNDAYSGSKELKFTIAKKAVTVDDISVKDKTYNGKKDDVDIVLTNASFNGKLENDNLSVSGITGTYVSADASEAQTVNLNASSNWTLSGDSVTNYELAGSGQPTSVTGKINKAALTVTAKGKNITYGQDAANDGVEYSGFVNNETASVLGGTLEYSYKTKDESPTDYTTSSPVGEYDIIPSGLTSDNYDISYVKGTLTVDKASLTATAEDKTVNYGDAAPDYTVVYSGWINGAETPTIAPVLTSTYTSTSNVGTYDITFLSAPVFENYEVTTVNGKLTVVEKPAPEPAPEPEKETEEYTVPVESEDTVQVEANIENGTAEVKEITKETLEEIVQPSEGKETTTDTIVIDLSQAKQDVTGIVLTAKSVENLKEVLASDKNEIKTVVIQMSEATVEIDAKTLEAVSKEADGNEVRLVVDKTEEKQLNTQQKETLENYNVDRTFEAYFESNGKRISSFNGGEVVVGIKFTPGEGKNANHFKIYYIDENGKEQKFATKYENGMLKFSTTHFSDYAIVYDEKAEVLLLEGKASGKNAIELSWNELDNTTKYVVYGNSCGKTAKKLKTVKNNKFTAKKIAGKKLVAHKTYKFYVVAYDAVGNKTKSKTIHFITANTKGKYANVKSIKTKKTSLQLAVGEFAQVGATYKVMFGKKHLGKEHGKALRYISDNPEVVSVSSTGKVLARQVGTATIYIQDMGGKYCKTTVTVQ